MVKKKKQIKGTGKKMENQEVLQEENLTEAQGQEELETGAAEPGKETGEAAQGELAQLAIELDAAKAKQEEYLNMAQRVQADFENFRRRNQGVRKEAYDDGAANFATNMLPVLDNLERAIDAAKDSLDPSLREGVEMVYRQFCEVFAKQGITPIDRAGEKFDPNLENAVMQAAPEDGEPGSVAEVLQKGYQMGNMVLRHAMVKVVPE